MDKLGSQKVKIGNLLLVKLCEFVHIVWCLVLWVLKIFKLNFAMYVF